ncbi:sodium-dependent transporter [Petroclostridium sp. X23]|uniref:sodium-dependent transporter n=1 Tax=Petroclostridium sp. X23 TaxID=3045146 RepID=UPI0024ADE191|nr:sodium-dependent transporter [Petroclostridium sp. X23]WHH57897.1 sodium-dependent transporter [Petroclostridium sp. X23]
MSNERGSWGSKIGLILAMAGNAVGLGNFWRFPYMAASNGGGAFLIPYFVALILVGVPLMFVEWNLGRFGGRRGHGTLGAMVYIQAREGINPRAAAVIGALCGMLAFSVTVLVNSYYNHIVGWALGYSFLSATGKYMSSSVDTVNLFVNFIGTPALSFTFWIIALVLLGIAVMRGVEKGIEAWARIMMPVLYILGFVLIIRALTLGAPNAAHPDWTPIAGLNYLWQPDFDKISFNTLLSACGQVFFTLSLGMGIICNYASYLKSNDDIVLSGISTVSLNEFAEVILGGTIVIPIAYAFGGAEGLGQGVGLSFMALPNIFRSMGGGQIFGTIWFLILFFAGFTSAIAMYNYLVALLEEDLSVARKYGAWIIFGLYILVGLPVGLEPVFYPGNTFYLDELDAWVGTYLLVVLGFIEISVAGWLMRNKAFEEINKGSYWKIPKWFFNLFIQFLTPIFLIIVLISSTIEKFQKGYFKWIPTFVADKPESIMWVQMARGVMLLILILGFTEAYRSIKANYGKELEINKVSTKN